MGVGCTDSAKLWAIGPIPVAIILLANQRKRGMKKSKPRNHVAMNPLLRKGGAHVRARSGKRFADKQQMLKAAREWKSSRDSLSLCFQ
ncbi:hypothetical protein [Microbulbifer halophilus]